MTLSLDAEGEERPDTGSSGAIIAAINSGNKIVAAAIAVKPCIANKALPMGAPAASAPNIAVPIHAITFPECCDPTVARPQATGAGDDKTLPGTKHTAPGDKDRGGQDRLTDGDQGSEIQCAGGSSQGQSQDDRLFRPLTIRKIAGPQSRHQGRTELAASYQPDHERAEAQVATDVDRKHGYPHTGYEETHEYDRHFRRECNEDIGSRCQCSCSKLKEYKTT
ncbi:hypothetical protein LZK75_17255 [Rhizobium leguminosarum]|nr:hypothetical protein LZK75_17255 [Rhizobium leguminosarum]